MSCPRTQHKDPARARTRTSLLDSNFFSVQLHKSFYKAEFIFFFMTAVSRDKSVQESNSVNHTLFIFAVMKQFGTEEVAQ